MNRRDFLKFAALTAGTAAGGTLLSSKIAGAVKPAVSGKAISDSAVRAMFFKVSYTTKIINPPKGGGKVDIWIPLPQSDDEQEITHLSVFSPHAFNINEERYYGNRMIYLKQKILKKNDNITITYSMMRKTSGAITDEGEDFKKHLLLTDREKWDENITAFADQVVGGGKSPIEIGRKIFYALADILTYDKEVPGCGEGRSIWTFVNKRGKCDDFHALFKTMMIYKGVPAKWEQGIAFPYPSVISKSGNFEGDCTGAHCWIRFYTGEGRWLPVDVAEANKRKDLRDYFFGTLSPNRFKVSTGRDIILNPPQAWEPLNSLPYTYVESDGVPLIYGHHYRNLIRYELIKIEV